MERRMGALAQANENLKDQYHIIMCKLVDRLQDCLGEVVEVKLLDDSVEKEVYGKYRASVLFTSGKGKKVIGHFTIDREVERRKTGVERHEWIETKTEWIVTAQFNVLGNQILKTIIMPDVSFDFELVSAEIGWPITKYLV